MFYDDHFQSIDILIFSNTSINLWLDKNILHFIHNNQIKQPNYKNNIIKLAQTIIWLQCTN